MAGKKQLLDKEQIKALYDPKNKMQWGAYTFGGHTNPASEDTVGNMLDGIPAVASKMYTEVLKLTSHLKPGITLEAAREVLEKRLKPLTTELAMISDYTAIDRPMPMAGDAASTLAASWNVFNENDSYGRHAQIALERAADVLGLPSPKHSKFSGKNNEGNKR